MNRLVYIAAAGALLVLGAAAQNPEDVAKMKAELDGVMKMKMVGAVTGGGSRAGRYAGRTRIALRAVTRMAADSTPHSPRRRSLSWSSPPVSFLRPADAPQGGGGGGYRWLLFA